MLKCWHRLMLGFGYASCIILLTFLPTAESKCAGLESAFDILPPGDHPIEEGSSLELFCRLNTSHKEAAGRSSKDLALSTDAPNQWEPYESFSIVNETTVKLVLNKPPPGSKLYYCSLNRSSSCLTHVQVGQKPQPVKNFQCKSKNWEYLTCTWTPPENFIKTTYKLRYSLNGRAGRTPRRCPNELDVQNNTCIFTHTTDPTYRQPHEYFIFELTGQNALGVNTETYNFHHYAHVIPDKPSSLRLINKTYDSALIEWDIPYPVFNFPPGLKFKIEYRSEWDPPDEWIAIDPKNEKNEALKIHNKSHAFNITGLKYAYAEYQIRVYLKSYAAKNGPEDWSEPATLNITTGSHPPSRPPKTTFGSFDIVSRGNDTDVFIYWNRINESLQNGPNFGYNVVCLTGNNVSCGQPTEKTLTYAKFPYIKNNEYRFTIYSANDVGRSLESSHVYVPKFDSVSQPESFTKVAYDGGVYELSWKPVDHLHLSNYTLFWCEDDKDLPVPCKGRIDWIHVGKDVTRKNVTMKDMRKFYKFAIAANLFDGTSSGMIWSSCVIFHDKVLKKVDDFYITNVASRKADVVWEVRCAQNSALRGFYIYYCPEDSSLMNNTCKGSKKEQKIDVPNGEERNITLRNLLPFTTYKLQVSIISSDGSQKVQVGPRSNTKSFKTAEDAPTQPLNLHVTNITNTSVVLLWSLPLETNGILRSYKLYNNYEFVENIPAEVYDVIVHSYLLNMLKSYTNYSFTLKACTTEIKCSNHSEPINVITLIGSPGQMSKPHISMSNATTADIEWEKPREPSGHLNYYEVSVNVKGQNDSVKIFNVTGTRGKISISDCKPKRSMEFRIRAINIDSENVGHPGLWSNATEEICGSAGLSQNVVLLSWVFGLITFLFVSALFGYLIKRGWRHCRKMKDVEVKLPPGLQSQELEKDTQDYVHLERWSPRTPELVLGPTGTTLSPDEESLLDKKSDESLDMTPYNMPVKNGGDSSGCSVGRESVSSSITSDTHISSDSGAEADQCIPGSNEKSFKHWDSSGRKRGHHNHNRNHSDVNDALDFANEVGDWQGYARVGFNVDSTPPEKSLPTKGYVTIASVTSANPASQKTGSDNGYILPTENVTSHFVERPNVAALGFAVRNQLTPAPPYIALASFHDQRNVKPPASVNGGSCIVNSAPSFDDSTERDEEASNDSTQEESSGNETETETVHGMPVNRNATPMPPYVSMIENPVRIPEKEQNGDSVRFSPDPLPSTKTVKEIDSALVDKINKDTESFSNYIPHHIFTKESIHS